MGDECAALYADGIGEDAPRHVLTLLVPGREDAPRHVLTLHVAIEMNINFVYICYDNRNLKEANKPETGKQRSKKQHITIVNNHFNIIKPKHEWIIQDINISEKFYNYQLSVLETLKTTGLTWHHTYDILALSNIIILTQQCPYQNFFTRKGWKIIIDTNPYKLKDPGIPPSMLASLHDAALKHLCGKDSLIYPDQTPLSRIEHLTNYEKGKDYEVQIDRSVKATRQRPDFSCTVDAHLQAGETINQQLYSKGGDALQSYIMDLRFDDLYRSWPFLTSRLVIDEPILPLIESNFIHFATRENVFPKLQKTIRVAYLIFFRLKE
ncbi:9780_t:CDS:10 [Rhizophagus irregularis]|nr:9780_t:CDS:10 [Rhizophagus irregularis]